MAIRIVCDYCRQEIERRADCRVLRAELDPAQPGAPLWTAHYHADACWQAVDTAISDAEDRAAATHGESGSPQPCRWQDVPLYEREHLILSALADRRLTVAELCHELKQVAPRVRANYGEAYAVIRRLLDAREVDRVKARRGARDLWLYFRRQRLEGPIVELELALTEDGLA